MTNTTQIKLGEKKLLKLTDMVKAKKAIKLLGHRRVNQILEFLKANPEGKTVTEIFVEIRAEQSEASQILAKMKEVNWVSAVRNGKCFIYSINQSELMSVMLLIERVHHNLFPQSMTPNREAFDLFRALGNQMRMNILNFIDEKGKSRVQPIYTTLNIEQSICSQHLAILRKSGIVGFEKDGKFVHYNINKIFLNQVFKYSRDYLNQLNMELSA